MQDPKHTHHARTNWPVSGPPLLRRDRANGAEQAILLVVGPSGEEQRVGGAVVGRALTERERPEAVDGQRAAGVGTELPGRQEEPVEELVIGGHAAVAEVADEEIAREAAEARRCLGETPGGVQVAEL